MRVGEGMVLPARDRRILRDIINFSQIIDGVIDTVRNANQFAAPFVAAVAYAAGNGRNLRFCDNILLSRKG